MFLAEGKKIVQEALNERQDISHIIGTSEFLKELKGISKGHECIEISAKEISRYSSLKTNQDGFALIRIGKKTDSDLLVSGWSLFLDSINDPGNLGTIIRTADWFGIKKVFCSPDTCDIFNPKAVMSTMGSIFRVELVYSSLDGILKKNSGLDVFAADLDGTPLSKVEFMENNGMVVLGNEAKGISDLTRSLVSNKLTIEGRGSAESLNVAQSSAIVIHELYKKGKI